MAFAQAIFEECWPRWQQHFSQTARLQLGTVELAALTDCTSDLAGHYLSADELSRWTGFSQKKRRTEWLGGRLAAKWAAAGLLGEATVDWQGLVIRSEEDGRPYVTSVSQPVAPFISISHSGPLAAALAANLPCGLDIQQPGAKIHRVKERFASLKEEDILKTSLPKSFPETERLTMLWAAKEAVRKMVQTRPLLGFMEIRLLAGHGGQGTPQKPLALTFASGRESAACPPNIAVLCFFANNLAWAMACPPMSTKE
ncbi:MAG: 4'-phosphopantetheinyl transferase superfamily protein [Deltaproteobacteria bacterium]|nr:4'-phosphopantetheinyl transferase superfamily protein [Deltaproteobacteria bacterium]